MADKLTLFKSGGVNSALLLPVCKPTLLDLPPALCKAVVPAITGKEKRLKSQLNSVEGTSHSKKKTASAQSTILIHINILVFSFSNLI
jgi:hypothetical protein